MISQLPGWMNQGQTVEKVFPNLEKACLVWIKTAGFAGQEIPLLKNFRRRGRS